ncbi:Hsp70 family protein [Aspergillus ibericus CBS 121593]|uniref:Actin-like ATPase domain-containing protein n=1 Tax=Aspergillus ibericus CBS 121593 TaxID=1448316 RepID=A0A395H967_9EURO|nr:hypothetical protein BO80DRAFT_488337 [Aspergillus ibericus CBS 121593]RAL03428.1 hypothetical protein BO80DRAFT_488337 [Aspergillus ibericus CBS 121593]
MTSSSTEDASSGESVAYEAIIVAADFGTTFSGVAWAQASNPDSHYIINQWPHDDSGSCYGPSSEKVPSEVAYEYNKTGPKCRWGFQIPHIMPRIQWIKLGLAPNEKLGIGSRLSASYSDCRRAPVPHHTSCEEVMLENRIGSSFNSKTLEYVITVPAIWPEKAKMATLSCAKKAGCCETSKMRIVSEPEAAAIHTLRAKSPHGLKVGDTIVVCDAGGGTVDLITFSIGRLVPNLHLKEEVPGNGALCGGSFLNRRFEEFLTGRLSNVPGWDRDTLDEAMQRFETVAKRSFSGNADDDIMFPVPGIADNEQLGVRRGRLRVSGCEMKELFQPVLEEVHDLVQRQIQSVYLRQYLEKSVFPRIEVLAPVDGWTAVVRGALAKTIGDVSDTAIKASVDSRKARENYGLIDSTKFISEVHDEKKKYWDYFEGEYHIDVMNWLIRKGDDIKEAEAIKTEWRRHQLVKRGAFDSIHVTLYKLDTPMGEKPPLYFNRHSRYRLPECRGADGKLYYIIDYAIHASYYSAHCEYELWYEGRNHGSVKADYV